MPHHPELEVNLLLRYAVVYMLRLSINRGNGFALSIEKHSHEAEQR